MKTLLILTLLFCVIEVQCQEADTILIDTSLIVGKHQKDSLYKDLIAYNNNLFEQNIKLSSELVRAKKDRNFWRCAFEVVIFGVGVGLLVKM